MTINPASEAASGAAARLHKTSDLVDFRVRKAILSEASAVFEDMFTLPQPAVPAILHGRPAGEHSSTSAPEYKDGIPVVAVAEDSNTLKRLLRICYPISNAPFDSIEVLSPVLAASAKYATDGVTPILRDALRTLTKRWPLRTYCLAMCYGFMEEAEEAAKATLQCSLRDLYSTTSLASAPELELIDGKVPLYLLCYHQSCSEALAHLKHDLPFSGRNWVWFKCLEDGNVCPAADWEVTMVDGSWVSREVVVGLHGLHFRDHV